MADGTVLNTGTGGDTIATDDIGGVKHQLVKMEYGAADSATQVSSANPLPTVQTGALPAGANAIGKLAANSGVDIGDVDVTSSALPTGASTSAKQPALGTAGTASTDVITVQGIASMTAVKVDGSGVTQPVSGTVTASGPLTDTQLRASAVPVDTEMPAAAALADGAANPTTPTVGAGVLLWNGTTWDRAPGGATNGITANLKALNGTTIATNSGTKDAGTQRVVIATDQVQLTNALKVDGSAVTQPISGNVTNAGTFAVQIAANSSVNQAQVAGTTTDTNSGNKSAGTQRVVLATDQPQLTNALKVDGSAVTQPVSGTVTTNPAAAAGAAGYSKFHLVSAGSTNATNVKASAGKLHGWYIYNSNAAARKVAFHNTTGTPTAGASVTDSIVIPPASAANVFTDVGIAFSTGIAITTVTDLTDAGTTAVAASDLVINLYYI